MTFSESSVSFVTTFKVLTLNSRAALAYHWHIAASSGLSWTLVPRLAAAAPVALGAASLSWYKCMATVHQKRYITVAASSYIKTFVVWYTYLLVCISTITSHFCGNHLLQLFLLLKRKAVMTYTNQNTVTRKYFILLYCKHLFWIEFLMLSDLLNDSLSFKTRELCLLLDANCIFDRLSSHVFFLIVCFSMKRFLIWIFCTQQLLFPLLFIRYQGCRVVAI